MYISLPVIVIILFVWAMNTSTQDEINDFFGSLFWMAVLFGGLALVGGVIFLAIAFGIEFWKEIFKIIQVLVLIGLIAGLIYVFVEHTKTAFKFFGLIALFIGGGNLIAYGITNHFNVAGYIICGILLAGCIYSWIPFVKNLVKCRGIK